MEFTCRVLESKDSLDYRRIRLESLHSNPESFGAKYEEQVGLQKLYVEELLEQRSNLIVMLGAFVDAELIGLCGLKINNDKQFEIIQMYVAGKVRGQGVSQKLLKLAISTLKNRRVTSLILTVYVDNDVALKTYKNAGFKIQSQQENEIIMIYEAQT